MTFEKPVRALPFVAALCLGLSACASQQHKAAPAAAAKTTSAPAASTAQAETKAPAPAAVVSAEPTGKKHKLWGSVVSFDSASGALALKDKAGRVHHLQVWSGAKYTKGGDHAAIAANDIHQGDLLTVWHVGEAAVAVHLNVKPGSSSEATVAKH